MVALLPAAWEAPEFVTPDWLASRRWAPFAPATQMHGLIANWFGQAGHHPRPFLALSYPGALKSMAVAHRHQPKPSPAVEGVLRLLAEFADFAD